MENLHEENKEQNQIEERGVNDDGLKSYILPISILIAAVMISGSLIYNTAGSGDMAADTSDTADVPSSPSASKVQPVTDADHIRGDKDAPIKIVEFSDLECPYCQSFHNTMKQIVDEYDEVAWVYRHFPLTNIHPSAMSAAEASECVSELGDNDKFWQFIDAIFDNQSSLSQSMLATTAESVGINGSDFNECMDSDRHLTKVESDLEDAVDSGGQGTPYSVLITESGQYVPINGAQRYNTVAEIVDQML